MAISDKLNYLIETKQLFKDRLNSLGAEITSSTTFRSYLTWLDTFYGEVSDKTNIATNGIVGRTSQETTTGKNLFKNIPSTNTKRGITFANNGEIIIITGTSNADYFPSIVFYANGDVSALDWYADESSIKSNKGYFNNNDVAYILSLFLNGNCSKTFRFAVGRETVVNYYNLADIQDYSYQFASGSEKINFVSIGFNHNTTVNLEVKIQIEQGSTATSYEPFTFGASPNPNFQQPINNLSGDVSYKVSGKNLLNKANDTYESWVSIDITDLIEDGVNYYVSIDYENLIGSCVIRIDYTYNGTINYIWGDGGSTGNVTEGTMYKQFNIPNHDVNTTIYLRVKDNGTGLTSGYYSNWLLAKSDTATDYEPYIEPQTFTIPLGDIELCKINTYEDKIYSSNGRLYLNKNINKVILNGSENWEKVSGTSTTDRYFVRNLMSDRKTGLGIMLSNYFSQVSSNQQVGIYNGQNVLLCVLDISTVNAFKTWLSTHNTIVYYALATPTTTEITQENYPALYNALKQIQDYLTAYKINKEFILGYSSPEIEY